MSSSILVVDDDADIRETLRTILTLQGYRVTVAGGAAEALTIMRTGEAPALIVLDVMMPGMDVHAFRAEQLGDQRLASIPVLILTGYGSAAETAAALGVAGVDKPVDMRVLVATVERLLAR